MWPIQWWMSMEVSDGGFGQNKWFSGEIPSESDRVE